MTPKSAQTELPRIFRQLESQFGKKLAFSCAENQKMILVWLL